MRFWKPSWLRSLRSRLLAAYVVGTLLTTGLVVFAFTALFTSQVDAVARHRMTNVALHIAGRIESDIAGRPVRLLLPLQWQWVYDELPLDVEFRVVDRDGNLVPVGLRPGQLLPTTLHLDPTQPATTVELLGRKVHAVGLSIGQADAGFYLQAAGSQRLMDLANLPLRKPIPIVAVITLAVSIPVLCGLMLLALGTLLRPLQNVSLAAARIDARNLSTRLSVDTAPKEIVPLIEAFNLTLQRLEHGYRVQQQFLGAAAHELKTPLALMRGQIELGGLEDRDTLLRDIDLMARQVHQLLHLAEVSESRNYKIAGVDVAEVAVEVVSFVSRMADRSQVQLDLHLPSEAVAWRGDQSALFTLLKNLVENAIQHSPEGGVVTLSVDRLGLSVRDEGDGIAAEQAARVFERFWRGHDAQGNPSTGAGLGLSICQEIAVAHGWTLRLCPALRGAWFRLDVEPAEPPALKGPQPAAAPAATPHPVRPDSFRGVPS